MALPIGGFMEMICIDNCQSVARENSIPLFRELTDWEAKLEAIAGQECDRLPDKQQGAPLTAFVSRHNNKRVYEGTPHMK